MCLVTRNFTREHTKFVSMILWDGVPVYLMLMSTMSAQLVCENVRLGELCLPRFWCPSCATCRCRPLLETLNSTSWCQSTNLNSSPGMESAHCTRSQPSRSSWHLHPGVSRTSLAGKQLQGAPAVLDGVVPGHLAAVFEAQDLPPKTVTQASRVLR